MVATAGVRRHDGVIDTVSADRARRDIVRLGAIVWIACVVTACGGEPRASLEPDVIRRSEWDQGTIRVVGLPPSAYLETTADGLRAAADLRVRIGGVEARPIAARAVGIDVQLTAELAVGRHDLDVHARGRDVHEDDALEVIDDELDGGIVPDAGDAGDGDAGESDAGDGDAGESDGGESDAGESDAGESDAGDGDAGESDAGDGDAGESDAGRPDAGDTDAGGIDAGEPDAGSRSDAGGDAGTTRPRPLAAGLSHTCALSSDGRLHCFGRNSSGQLGLGTFSVGTSVPTEVGGLDAVIDLDAGSDHTCAITSDGALHCWGRNASGQLGVGDLVDRASPTRVGTELWIAVGAGWDHTCAIRRDGSLWCWGENNDGQLGSGGGADQSTPTRAGTATDWVEVRGGRAHTCGIAAAVSGSPGILWCWGRNAAGQLGDGTTTRRRAPVPVAGGATWIDVAGGDSHTCAVRADGAALCWGAGTGGRLGSGDTADSAAPQLVAGATTWTAIAAADTFSCGVDVAGAIWCWGRNASGAMALGGDLSDQLVPRRTMFPAFTVGVDALHNHTCAFTSDGTLRCAGRNTFGEVGAAPGPRTSPVVVALP